MINDIVSKLKIFLISKFIRIKRVHLVKQGFKTICIAKLTDDSVIYYNWDRAFNRDLIRKCTVHNAYILVDNNVTKGWNYGK